MATSASTFLPTPDPTPIPTSRFPRPFRFLDLPAETRINIYRLSTATLVLHIRPRLLTFAGELTESPTTCILTNCPLLSASRQIRSEALPFIQHSPTILICRSAVAECGNSANLNAILNFASDDDPPPPMLLSLSQVPLHHQALCPHHGSPISQLQTSSPCALTRYFSTGFAALHHDTKPLVRRWTKLIEATQHAPHPFAHLLAPRWWPEGVRHCHVDHLSKADRITLLTHVLISASTPTLSQVTTLSLAACTAAHVAELGNPNALELLEEMFRVRRLIEQMDGRQRAPSRVGVEGVDRPVYQSTGQ